MVKWLHGNLITCPSNHYLQDFNLHLTVKLFFRLFNLNVKLLMALRNQSKKSPDWFRGLTVHFHILERVIELAPHAVKNISHSSHKLWIKVHFNC